MKIFMNIMIMRRGQIWLYNTDPTVGDEISKIRPCVIVSNDDLGILRSLGFPGTTTIPDLL